jgi:hypothetical protein
VIHQSAVFENSGKVGVGTTAPAASLDVLGNSRDILIGDPGCGAGFAGIGFVSFSGCTKYSMIGDGTSTYLNRPSGGSLHFREGNSAEQMTIASGGNVGIGNTNPASKLDVVGNGRDILIGDPGCGPGFAGIGFVGFSGCTKYSMSGDGTSTYINRPSGGSLHFREGNSVEQMTIASGGDVRIAVPAVNGNPALTVTATGTSAVNFAVAGFADGPSGVGVFGEAQNGSDAFGVEGISGSGLAGAFFGNTSVTGNLDVGGAITAGTKDFKIDHPLDPANKYLYHASVESSEMKNMYDGVAVLDASGQATVQLPAWFEAVNTDFRYQLTAIGGAAPDLHIAREVANHQFSIAGGATGLKVSWQVTGVRHDAYAQAHPTVVEVDKPANERGYYIHPALYGKSDERGIWWGRAPEKMRQIKQHQANLVQNTKH